MGWLSMSNSCFMTSVFSLPCPMRSRTPMMHLTWCHKYAWPTSVSSHMSYAGNNFQILIITEKIFRLHWVQSWHKGVRIIQSVKQLVTDWIARIQFMAGTETPFPLSSHADLSLGPPKSSCNACWGPFPRKYSKQADPSSSLSYVKNTQRFT